MRINNKGFMLIEVIVTSTVVLTSMLVLYSSFSKLYNSFKVKNTYYDVDGVYAAREIVKRMIEVDGDFNINKFLQKFAGNEDEDDGNVLPLKNLSLMLEDGSFSDETCEKIKKLYKIKSAYLLEYDEGVLKSYTENVEGKGWPNQTFKEYVDYLLKYYADDLPDRLNDDSGEISTEYKYIVLIEYGDENNYKYANLRLR